MADEEIEVIDSPNDEVEENLEEEESTEDTDAEKAELKKKNQSLYERLKKAEGFVRNEEGKWVKKPAPETKTEKPTSKSNELDYGQKAFLTANGIKGTKEFEFVKAELKASGQDLESLLENDYFQLKLEKMRELNKTADATPTGRRSGGVPTDSVEYWMTKPIEEVPIDMRLKVVNAKIAQTKTKGVFYNS